MSKLADVLASPDKKDRVVQDCVQIIDAEVADKGGFGGMAIKGGYAAVKGVKPGFVKNVVTDLLPQFADAVDPIYEEAVAQGRPVKQHFVDNAGRVADNLLAITDGKAERSTNNLVKKTYAKLRGQAKTHVTAAVPRVGELIEKHTA